VSDAILILNAGSSSLKFSVFLAGAPVRLLVRGEVDGLASSPRFRATDAEGRVVADRSWDGSGMKGHPDAIEFLLRWGREHGVRDHRVIAAGHRVVHGGRRFIRPVRVDAAVLEHLRTLIPLAPLHEPHNIAAIDAVSRAAPGLPQVACFDTAFHRSQPAAAQSFAIPRAYSEAGVVRYGFHGLSYEYIAGALARLSTRAAEGRTIVAHLGNGASMCAMLGGRSVATTMGFTPIDGLVMGTRSGSIDPGVLLYLLQHEGRSPGEVQRLLYEESGLLGVSGISGDMRTLLGSDDPRAREAIDLFVYRAAREIGSLTAALGGLDAIVFTGGIGENAPAIRGAICRASEWAGVRLDAEANERAGPRICRPESGVEAWVVPTNEELMIARHTLALLAPGSDMERERAQGGDA
jgi:acetate kinase